MLRKETINNSLSLPKFYFPSPVHLTFFQKLRKCVNERVGHICILYACIAVKGRTVVVCIGKSLYLLCVYFFILVFCMVKIPIRLYSGFLGAAGLHKYIVFPALV